MPTDTTRRGVVAAILAAGIGGLGATSAGDLLEQFAPLSGAAWDAADRSLSGSVESPHGSATVRVDGEGVPHVEADGERAAYFAVGYVHAFDRLFQLDLQRRVMRGRLSEVVGEVTLDSDEFHAAMDFAGAAEATWDVVADGPAGPAVEAYVDGVNAAIERERLPVEFELLGYEPDPWTPADSMLMEKQISWGLTGDFGTLRRALVADRLGEDVAAKLYPDRLDHDVPIVRERRSGDDPNGSTDRAAESVDRFGAERVDADRRTDGESPPDRALIDWLSKFDRPRGIGSNSWVVAGEHTASGNPIVANDPHLTLMAPPVWYEQHVETSDVSVRGATFPGVPFVVIGASERGAWGFTNVGADVLDVYRYEIDDAGERYRYRGEWREFDREERVIPVTDGDDRTLEVRKTVHGPVIEREERTVGVAWTGLTATRTTDAIYRYARADGLEEVLAATERFDSPTQNIVYADRDGRTLYYATGKLPIRRVGGDPVSGDRIFDGSAGEGEWRGFEPYGESSWDGFVPFAEKPGVVDPDYLATANQRVVDDPDHYVGTAFASPYRGARIYDRLDERAASDEPMDPAFNRDLQRDTLDRRAAQLVPDLLAAVDAETVDRGEEGRGTPDDADLTEATRALAAWDYRMDRDSRAALLFERWFAAFRREVLEPTFGDADLDESYYPTDWVIATLPADSDFFAERSREATMVAALREAVAEIDEAGWETYGDRVTTGAIDHPLGGEAEFLNYPSLPTDGSSATVNNVRVDDAVGSSWRMVVEVGGEASAILPGGNSGDYFSDHYHDQLRRWADGEYKPMDRESAGEVAVEFEEGSR